MRLAPNLGWRDVALREALVKALEAPAFPISVENDANLAVRAEHRYGPYAGVGNLIYVNGQAGVGAGIIADGRLLRGGAGLAASSATCRSTRPGRPVRAGGADAWRRSPASGPW